MLFVVVLGVFLVLYNNVVNLVGVGWVAYVPLNLAVGAALVGVAVLGGYSWSALGFSRAGVGPGLRWGVAIAAIILVGLVVALLAPALEPLLHDRRVARLTAAGLAYTVLVRIPLGTALFEEVAFRGVFFGVLSQNLSVPAAVVWSSVVFGIWHIVPMLDLIRINQVGMPGWLVGFAVLGGVVATAVGGVLFCWLRIHTGGLVAPVIAHASINSLATLASYYAQRG